jgi:hypothetical protein
MSVVFRPPLELPSSGFASAFVFRPRFSPGAAVACSTAGSAS